jgi:hypothetical protein
MCYEVLKDFAGPAVTLLGIIVTGAIAAFGFRTFEKWKREKIEERRIEVAIDALAIAYEAKFVFESVRSPFIRSYEYEGGYTEADSVRITLRDGQKGPYAVLKRLEQHEDFFTRIRKVEPVFMAIFGRETESIFKRLYEARTLLEHQAQGLFEEERYETDPKDIGARDRKRELRASVFASADEKKKDDKIGDLVKEFTERIEGICRPIVDQEFRGKGRKSPISGALGAILRDSEGVTG